MSAAPGDGERMHALLSRLFPQMRSIAGPGFRAALDALEEVAGPLERHRFASGEQVFDWTVPDEWDVREAWIAGPDGRRVVDLAHSTLHVVAHSEPVHLRLSRTELDAHLHSLPAQPGAIPYVTSFYGRGWGFCLTQRQRDALPDGEYEVRIDADLGPGHVVVGEAVVPGSDPAAGEVLLSTYCCHPSLANNELSGPVVAAQLVAWLRALPVQPRHTYRVLFLPETIGSIAWLSRFGERARQRVRAGWVMTCCGDPGAFTYKPSRRGDTLADRAALHVLRALGVPHREVPFVPLGSDERQFCSPGFDLPMGSLMRTMYGEYPQYHTSLDDLSFVTPEGLQGTLDAYRRLVQTVEANAVVWRNAQPFCEPQLGRRGLFPPPGGDHKARDAAVADMLWVLSLCDGETELIDVAERCGRPVWELAPVCEKLAAHGLLEPVRADAGARLAAA